MFTTKYSPAKGWFFALLVWAGILILAFVASGCVPQNSTTPVPTEIEQNISMEVPAVIVAEVKAKINPRIGGDCLADRYSGDVWKKYDWYCQPDEGAGNSVVEVLVEATRKAKERIVATLTAIVTPTVPSTNTPTASPTQPEPTITGTPSPTQKPSKTPTVTATNPPDETSTPEPEETPKPTKTVKPTKTSTPEPTETSAPDCKNKNSAKDGTPAECNAGIGQEKND